MSGLCAAVLALGGAVPVAGITADAPRPLAYVVLPDLRATLEHVEAMAATVAPGTLPPGALTAGLGAQLGDPGLSSLGPGPILLVLTRGATPADRPSLAAYLPVSNPEPYAKALTTMGWTVRRAPGLVIGTSTAATPPAVEYERMAAGTFTGDLRVSLNASELLDAYGPTFRMAIAGLAAGMAAHAPPPAAPGGPPPAAAGKMLQMEARAFLLLLEQTESVTSDVSLQAEAVASETVIAARPGSPLAELASQPPPVAGGGAAALLSRPMLMAAAYQLDGPRLSAFLADLLRRAAADPETAKRITPEVLALTETSGRVFTGEAAVALRAGAGPAPLASETVARVNDEAAALALLEKSTALLSPGGPWSTFYEDFGFPLRMTLRRNARRHGGRAVHRLEIASEARGMPPEQQALNAMFVRDSEFAFAHGYLLSAQDPQALDALIDRALAPRAAPASPLQSARAFGAGAHAYVDYDVFGLVRTVMGAVPRAGESPFAALPATDANPLVYALWLGDQRIRVQAKMPLQPIATLVQALKSRKPAN